MASGQKRRNECEDSVAASTPERRKLEAAKRLYVDEKIGLDELERRIERALDPNVAIRERRAEREREIVSRSMMLPEDTYPVRRKHWERERSRPDPTKRRRY